MGQLPRPGPFDGSRELGEALVGLPPFGSLREGEFVGSCTHIPKDLNVVLKVSVAGAKEATQTSWQPLRWGVGCHSKQKEFFYFVTHWPQGTLT